MQGDIQIVNGVSYVYIDEKNVCCRVCNKIMIKWLVNAHASQHFSGQHPPPIINKQHDIGVAESCLRSEDLRKSDSESPNEMQNLILQQKATVPADLILESNGKVRTDMSLLCKAMATVPIQSLNREDKIDIHSKCSTPVPVQLPNIETLTTLPAQLLSREDKIDMPRKIITTVPIQLLCRESIPALPAQLLSREDKIDMPRKITTTVPVQLPNREYEIVLPQKQVVNESFVKPLSKKVKFDKLAMKIKASKKIEMHINKIILVYSCCQTLVKLRLFRKWKRLIN